MCLSVHNKTKWMSLPCLRVLFFPVEISFYLYSALYLNSWSPFMAHRVKQRCNSKRFL